jgi:plastocyanin
LFRGLAAVPLLIGCVVTGSTAGSPVDVEVTIGSAPGTTLGFVPAETTVLASGSIQVTFRNASNQPHNLVFTEGVSGATRTIVEPGGFDRLLLARPSPGVYLFVCTIHDGMNGRLVVEAPPPA